MSSYSTTFITQAQQTYISTGAPPLSSATQLASSSIPTSVLPAEAATTAAAAAATTTSSPGAYSRLLPADFAAIAVGSAAFVIVLSVIIGAMVSCFRRRRREKQREHQLADWPAGTRFASAGCQEKGAGFSGVWFDKTPVGVLRGIASFKRDSKPTPAATPSVNATTSLISQRQSRPSRKVKDSSSFHGQSPPSQRAKESSALQARQGSTDSVQSQESKSSLLPKQKTQKPLPPTPPASSPSIIAFGQIQTPARGALNNAASQQKAVKLPDSAQSALVKKQQQTNNLPNQRNPSESKQAQSSLPAKENKERGKRPGPQSNWTIVSGDEQTQLLKRGPKPSIVSTTASSRNAAATRFPIKLPNESATAQTGDGQESKSSLQPRPNGLAGPPDTNFNASSASNKPPSPPEQPGAKAAHPSLSQSRGPSHKNLSINTVKVREYSESAKKRLPTIEQAPPPNGLSPSSAPLSRFNHSGFALLSKASNGSLSKTHVSRMAVICSASPESSSSSSAKQPSPTTAPPLPSAPAISPPMRSTNAITPGSTVSSNPSYLPRYYMGDLQTPAATSPPSAAFAALPSGSGADVFVEAPRSPSMTHPQRSPVSNVQQQEQQQQQQHVMTQGQLPRQVESILVSNENAGDDNDHYSHRGSTQTTTTIESYASDDTTPPDETGGYFRVPHDQHYYGHQNHVEGSAQGTQHDAMPHSAAASSPLMHSPVIAHSPISEIRYPKVPRSTNQAVPRSLKQPPPREHSWSSSSSKTVTKASPSPRSVKVPRSPGTRWPLLSPSSASHASSTTNTLRRYMTISDGDKTVSPVAVQFRSRLSTEIPFGASALSPAYSLSTYSPLPVHDQPLLPLQQQQQQQQKQLEQPQQRQDQEQREQQKKQKKQITKQPSPKAPQMQYRARNDDNQKKDHRVPGILNLSESSDPAISDDALFSAGTGKPLMSPLWQPQLTPRRNTEGDMILDVL